jgi:hypothetical protein
VHTGAAGAALVNIIHNFRKVDGLAINKGDAQRASSGRISFLAGCVTYGANVVAHPAKTAGINMLLALIIHYHRFFLPIH